MALKSEKMLAGRRVLVVEDQYFIADDLRRILSDAGAEVVGPTPDAAQALQWLEGEKPDFALLDINLGDGTAYPVARELMRCGTPFAFVTGYLPSMVAPEFQSVPYIDKPFNAARILAAVSRAPGETDGAGAR
jgi:DNA-binding response OmpR family regulator